MSNLFSRMEAIEAVANIVISVAFFVYILKSLNDMNREMDDL